MLINSEIERKFEETNKKLGNSMKIMKSTTNVIGREQELFDLAIITERKETPVPCIVSEAGTGKTAVIETYMNIMISKGEVVIPIEIDIGAMAEDLDVLKVRLSKMMSYIKEFKDEVLKYKPNAKLYLFIDEVHKIVSIFPRGTKIGGDLLKTTLAKAEEYCVVITATTPSEYDKHIGTDDAFDRRLKRITMKEVNKETTLQILRNWLEKYTTTENNLSEKFDDRILEAIYNYNLQYRTDKSEPAKSLDVLINLESANRVLNRPVDISLVNYIFERQYQVDLNFNVDLEKATNIINRRILGQPIAVNAMRNLLLEMKINAAKKEMKPKFVGLFVGSTGVGKTEMAKALAEAIFGSDQKLIEISLSDYTESNAAPRFRRDLGSKVKYKQSAVVLLDELEKADKDILNVLLPVFDEGKLVYEIAGAEGDMEPQTVSLRNTIIIATSNAGAETFDAIDKHSKTLFVGNEMTDEYLIAQRNLQETIHEALINSELKPEFLNRVNATVPFLPLAQETMINIAEIKIKKSLNEIEELLNKTVVFPDEVEGKKAALGTGKMYSPLALYVVKERMKTKDSKANGARKIDNIIRTDIRQPLLIAINKYEKQYDYYTFETNGKCIWETDKSGIKQGLLRIKPLRNRFHKSII